MWGLMRPSAPAVSAEVFVTRDHLERVMRRVGRWVRRLAVLVGIAAFVLVVAWAWIVPPLVKRGIVSQFEAFGLPEPTFRVRGVSPSDLQISDLLADFLPYQLLF